MTPKTHINLLILMTKMKINSINAILTKMSLKKQYKINKTKSRTIKNPYKTSWSKYKKYVFHKPNQTQKSSN